MALLLPACTEPRTTERKPRTNEPRITQEITPFNKPESAAFSLDGQYVFVTNCASGYYGRRKTFGLGVGLGAITKLRVDSTGRLHLVKLRFVDSLSAPLGITVLPRATATFPKGALFVALGNGFSVDPRTGEYENYAWKLRTGVGVFDPESGRPLGFLDCGVSGPLRQAIGHALLIPNGLAFDADGNLYIADSSLETNRFIPKLGYHPGIVRLTPRGIDQLAARAPAVEATFLPVAAGTNGVAYNPRDSTVYFVTTKDTLGRGCVYRLPPGPLGILPDKPLHDHLKGMDGLAFTPAGTLLVSRFQNDLLAIRPDGRRETLLAGTALQSPSDIKLWMPPGGPGWLLVPEQDVRGRPWQQRLLVVGLPDGF